MTAPIRHIDLAVDAPLAEWPMEAIEALLDRGTIGDWRVIATEIGRSPWGAVARTVDTIAGWDEHGEVDTLMRIVIDRARAAHCRRP